MARISGEAGQAGRKAPRRQGAKAPGGGRGQTVRQQFHLGADTVRRLGVHAALLQRDRSGVVEEVLLSYLARHGRGRELFDPVEIVDRQDGGDEISE